MISEPFNPFRPTKIEHDRDPVFWLSGQAKELSTTMKHAHVSGSRGSGKTTLLRSLRTADIRTNETLRVQYTRQSFDWFGLYIQFNRTLQTVTSGISRAITKYIEHKGLQDYITKDDLELKIFSYYLEITLLQAFCDDIIENRNRKDVYLPAVTERNCCVEILRRISISPSARFPDVYSVKAEISNVKDLFTSLPTENSLDSLVERLNTFTTGAILDQLVEMISSLRGQMMRKDKAIRTIIMIDDCESLSERQQSILNTILKSYEGKAKFIIAFISGQYDRNTTILPNTVLKDDDFVPVKLDDERRGRTREFFEHVTRTRFEYYYSQDPSSTRRTLPKFDLANVLGDPSPNKFLATLVASSTAQTVRSWAGDVARAKEELRKIVERKRWSIWSLEDDQSPFIECSVLDWMNVKFNELRVVRLQEGLPKQIDRKQIGTLIYLVDRYFPRSPIPYAGYNTVINLSGNCIRDYLDIMACIYDESINPSRHDPQGRHRMSDDLFRFSAPRQPIRWEVQASGILRASKSKWKSLLDFQVKSDFSVSDVIAGLSTLLVALQKSDAARKALATPERGKFTFDPVVLDRVLEIRRSKLRARDFMKTLQRDGFVRLVPDPEQTPSLTKATGLVEFQLHNRLYPELRVSHRGPYELFRLDEVSFAELLIGSSSIDPKKWALSMIKKDKPVSQNQQDFGL